MKKIINWTFGSVFRTFGRILAYIGVGILFAFILSKKDIKIIDLLGIEKVNAATSITPQSWGSKVEFERWHPNSGYVDSNQSNWVTGDYTNFCTGGYMCYIRNNWIFVKLSTSLDPARTYTMNFTTYMTTRATQNFYKTRVTYNLMGSNTGEYNGSSTSAFSAFNCTPGISEGTTSRVDWSCSFTPSKQVNYIYLRITFDVPQPDTFTSYGATIPSIIYDNSQTDAINQQTSIIQNEFTDITNQINENNQLILDGLNGIYEANQVCQFIDKSNIAIDNSFLSNGNITSSTAYGITDYISINSSSELKVVDKISNYAELCFYDTNKSKISCIYNNTMTVNQIITIPNNASYFRASIAKDSNRPTFNLCKNGNQALNDTLTDDNTSEAENEAGSFFENFTTNTHGLTSIITAPLTAIESLTSKSCSPLVLPLPFVNEDLTLPCMRPIYEEYFGGFMTLYDAITLGIVSYWILVRIFALVKDFKNPDHDEIEVVDL